MTKKLLGSGTFRDDNSADWEISVYRDDSNGRPRHDTVIRSPEGEFYRPEEDVLGDFWLVDKHGNERSDDLPMDLAVFQREMERIEEKAWGYSSPLLNPIRSASQTQQPAAQSAPASEPEPEAKGGWRERIRAGLERIRESGMER